MQVIPEVSNLLWTICSLGTPNQFYKRLGRSPERLISMRSRLVIADTSGTWSWSLRTAPSCCFCLCSKYRSTKKFLAYIKVSQDVRDRSNVLWGLCKLTTQFQPSFRAWAQHPRIFLHPSFTRPLPFNTSWNVTSEFPCRCERMAYCGILAPKNSSSSNVVVLRSRILLHQKHQPCTKMSPWQLGNWGAFGKLWKSDWS